MSWVRMTVDEAKEKQIIVGKDIDALFGCGCAECKKMGVRIERLYHDDSLGRLVSIYFLEHGIEKCPPSWGYNLIDLTGPDARSYYAAANMDDVEYASWEGRMVGRLHSSKDERNEAYYFATAERFYKGRTEESIVVAGIVSRNAIKAGYHVCLPAWTDPEQAEKDALECLKMEGSEGVRVHVRDIRENTLSGLTRIASLLALHSLVTTSQGVVSMKSLGKTHEANKALNVPVGINPAVPDLADMEYMTEQMGFDKKLAPSFAAPYVFKPYYTGGLLQWVTEVLDRSFAEVVFEEREKHPKLVEAFKAAGFNLEIDEIGQKMVDKEEDQCDCGAKGVMQCVECKQWACFNCLSKGRCKFCRGE